MFTLIWSVIAVFIPIFPSWLILLIGALLLALDVLVIWRLIK